MNVVSQPPADAVFIFYVALTGLLTVSSLATVCIVWRQTQATKDTVETLMNAERPWLLVEGLDYQPGGASKDRNACWITMKNWGKSPAEIVEIGGTFKYASYDELPSIPYGKIKFHNPFPIVNERCSNPFPIEDETGHMTFEDQMKMREQGKPLMAFGFVKYRDLSKREKPYETRFCYCIT